MIWVPMSKRSAICMMMASYGLNSLGYSGYHVNHIDLTPRYAPLLYGVTSSVAMTSGVLSTSLNGHLLGMQPTADDWRLVFSLSAGIQVVGGLLWLAAASGERQKWC